MIQNDNAYKIKLDDFTEDYRQIAECIGIDAAMKLIKSFSGCQVYVPKYETTMRPIRNRTIKAEFDGSNYKKLACRYGLSESRTRQIIRDESL